MVFAPPVVCGVSVGILLAPSVVPAGAMNSFSLILTESCFLFLYHVSTLSGRLSTRPKVDNHNFGASCSQSPNFSGLCWHGFGPCGAFHIMQEVMGAGAPLTSPGSTAQVWSSSNTEWCWHILDPAQEHTGW